jgi:hypothetical protein
MSRQEALVTRHAVFVSCRHRREWSLPDAGRSNLPAQSTKSPVNGLQCLWSQSTRLVFRNPFVGCDHRVVAMVLALITHVGHHTRQRIAADRQRPVSILPLELGGADDIVVDGIGTCAFELTKASAKASFGGTDTTMCR